MEWHNLSLDMSGTLASGSFDGHSLFYQHVSQVSTNGQAAIGSSYHEVIFDNWRVAPSTTPTPVPSAGSVIGRVSLSPFGIKSLPFPSAAQVLQTPALNTSFLAGLAIRVNTTIPLRLSGLGRWLTAFSNNSHTVSLYNATALPCNFVNGGSCSANASSAVPKLASATVNMGICGSSKGSDKVDDLGFCYAPSPAVELSSGAYFLVSSERTASGASASPPELVGSDLCFAAGVVSSHYATVHGVNLLGKVTLAGGVWKWEGDQVKTCVDTASSAQCHSANYLCTSCSSSDWLAPSCPPNWNFQSQCCATWTASCGSVTQNAHGHQSYGPVSMLLERHQHRALKTIDREAVVRRHTVRFANARPAVGGDEFCTPNSTSSAFSQLTVGNGDWAFTADLTGLQSLNRSYGSSSDFGFPALTQASWGWHTPDFKRIDPTMPSPWREDGSLNLIYQNFSVVSLDDRPGHGNRTIFYLLNCEEHNDPRLCHWWYNFPVRTSLGQLSFVQGHDAAPLQLQIAYRYADMITMIFFRLQVLVDGLFKGFGHKKGAR